MGSVLEGCLVIADISGYTRYVSGVELEHSADVLADLLNTVVGQLDGGFRIAKLEGDAVFGFTTQPIGGPAAFAAMEAGYAAFADRRDAIVRASTCPCKACGEISALELKLVLHQGQFATHRVGKQSELVGADVILAHRLLKNTVTARTGWRGYAMLTQAAVEGLGLDTGKLPMVQHTETFEGVGEVSSLVYDLCEPHRRQLEDRAVYVSDEDADLVFQFQTSAAPAVSWEYLTSPRLQEQWRAEREEHDNPKGVPGVGSVAHCVHGKMKMTHEVVDWKPYRYYTYRSLIPILGKFLCTDEISPIDGEQWNVAHRIRAIGGIRQRGALRLFGSKQKTETNKAMDKLQRLLAVAAERTESELSS